MKEKAVILLSGGLDSTVCVAVAAEQGFELLPLSFNYQQKHLRELAAAQAVAAHYQVQKHLIIETNMGDIGGSSLTDKNFAMPKGELERSEIPNTYVPARNLIFLSYALGYAEASGARRIFIGVNARDYSGYPDCRPEFIRLFQSMADYTTKTAVETKEPIFIETPLIDLTKKEIVLLGTKLAAPLELTTSCYEGGEEACGTCDSCLLRLNGFAAAQVKDPIRYRGSE